MKKHIILVGLSGVGKTTMGNLLSRHVKIPFLDVDEAIEQQEKQSIFKLFNERGEAYFRVIETDFLLQALEMPVKIIATGAGIILKKCNRSAMKGHQVIYLKRPLEDILQEDLTNRPLLYQEDTRKKLMEMAAIRNPLYEEVADFTIINIDIRKTMIELEEYIDEIARFTGTQFT